MNPSGGAAQADNIPLVLFFQNGKLGAVVKQRDLGRGGIVPGVYRRFRFGYIPSRVEEDVVRICPAAG